MPIFSVIIPLYNKGPHIERALNSVLNQTVKDFEVIVIDGGSNDNGPDIVRKYKDSRIRFIEQEGKGVSTARNQAVEASNSELIALLDADDEWMPKHLEVILQLKHDFPEAGAYTTAYQILEEDGKLRMADYKEIPDTPWRGEIPNYFKSGALGDYPVWTSVVCIPKKIYLEMEGFPEDTWFGEDADLFGRIALKYSIAFDWYTGGIYHWEAINRACKKERPLTAEPIISNAEDFIKNNSLDSEILEGVKEYLFTKEADRALRLLDNGNNLSALKILMKHRTKHKKRERSILIFLALTYLYPFNKYIQERKNKSI
jgi:glycosyltransferase involved in cell wall biosynthesis